MQLASQIIFMGSFGTFIGLASSIFWEKSVKKKGLTEIYWALGLSLFTCSALAFYLASWPHKLFLFIADISLLGGVLCIALLLDEWNQSLTSIKKILSYAWFIFVVTFLAYYLNFGTPQDRLITINVALSVIILWQLTTLSRLIKNDGAYQIKLLFAVELIQLCIRVPYAFLLSWHPNTLLPSLYQESALGASLNITSFIPNVIVCILITNHHLEKLTGEHQKITQAIEAGMLHSLNALSMARDNETGNHIIRTKNYVHAIANRLKILGLYKDELTDDAIANMVKAAPLHDIGKVGIPDNILKKEGSLTPEEWMIMKTHASLGEEVLQAAKVQYKKHTKALDAAIKIAGGHHECWDGSGYPRGLSGTNIPLAARIMSIADIYDALVSERVYKKKWSYEDAFSEILRLQGTRFDPAVVEAFMMEHDNFVCIAKKYIDEI
jgi:hypothetical protein